MLMGLNFSIEYKKDKDIVMADALLRQPQGGSLATIFHITPQFPVEAKDSWKIDMKLQKIVDKVRLHQGSYKHYTLISCQLF